MTANTERWQSYLPTAVLAAREAGKILQDWKARFTITEKSRFNLVTEADFAAEKRISEILQAEFPTHGYLGEEGLQTSGQDSDYLWIIDPLDGTGNYTHGFPYYCVSIGLQYQNEIVLGVIYDPTRDELFTACRGAGAFLNEQPIHVSETKSLNQAMCVASLPLASDPQHPAVQRFLNMLPHAQTIQRLGSAALNLSYLACGRLDVFWSTTLKPWDMAAGVVIVEEAGGTITRLDGSPHDVHRLEVLGTSAAELQTEILPLLELKSN